MIYDSNHSHNEFPSMFYSFYAFVFNFFQMKIFLIKCQRLNYVNEIITKRKLIKACTCKTYNIIDDCLYLINCIHSQRGKVSPENCLQWVIITYRRTACVNSKLPRVSVCERNFDSCVVRSSNRIMPCGNTRSQMVGAKTCHTKHSYTNQLLYSHIIHATTVARRAQTQHIFRGLENIFAHQLTYQNVSDFRFDIIVLSSDYGCHTNCSAFTAVYIEIKSRSISNWNFLPPFIQRVCHFTLDREKFQYFL